MWSRGRESWNWAWGNMTAFNLPPKPQPPLYPSSILGPHGNPYATLSSSPAPQHANPKKIRKNTKKRASKSTEYKNEMQIHNVSDDVLMLEQAKAQEQKWELSLWCMFWITTLSLLRGKKLLICCASMAKLFFLFLVFMGHCLNMVSICQWQGTKLRAQGLTAFHQELIYDTHPHRRCRSSFPHTMCPYSNNIVGGGLKPLKIMLTNEDIIV